jgi:hypothetical protein
MQQTLISKVLHAMPSGGMAFYNCGEHSGRSQPHKHLQVVPLPFDAAQPARPPVQPAVDTACDGAAAMEVSCHMARQGKAWQGSKRVGWTRHGHGGDGLCSNAEGMQPQASVDSCVTHSKAGGGLPRECSHANGAGKETLMFINLSCTALAVRWCALPLCSFHISSFILVTLVRSFLTPPSVSVPLLSNPCLLRFGS